MFILLMNIHARFKTLWLKLNQTQLIILTIHNLKSRKNKIFWFIESVNY
jgi:hypothetical protein